MEFYDNLQKRYDNLYSRGGEVERSFWQNVGKIVNKKAVYETPSEVFETILKETERILKGERN